jgi:hypothetical protein
MEVIMTEKLFILFVADAVINQHELVTIFNEQASHGPGTHVIFVGRVQFVPNGFRNHAKHGATVEFEHSGIDCMYLHVIIKICFCFLLWKLKSARINP